MRQTHKDGAGIYQVKQRRSIAKQKTIVFEAKQEKNSTLPGIKTVTCVVLCSNERMVCVTRRCDFDSETLTFRCIHHDERRIERIPRRSRISSSGKRMLLLMAVAFATGCPVAQVMSGT